MTNPQGIRFRLYGLGFWAWGCMFQDSGVGGGGIQTTKIHLALVVDWNVAFRKEENPKPHITPV